MNSIVWQQGDCFVFVFEAPTAANDGDVIYGEIVEPLPGGAYRVRVSCAGARGSSLEVYERCCLTARISRADMDRSARAGWPSSAAWISPLLGD